MAQVIKVSKAGVNVLTATDPNDFIMDSTLNTFKIIAEGTHQHTVGTTATESFSQKAHSQSGTPFVIAYCKFADGSVSPIGCKAGAGVNAWTTEMRVDGTNIDFGYINDTGGNYTFTWKYYIVEAPI